MVTSIIINLSPVEMSGPLFIFGWVPDKDDSSRLLAVPSCSD